MATSTPVYASLDQMLGSFAKHVNVDRFVTKRPLGVLDVGDIPNDYLKEAVEAALYVSRICPMRAREMAPDAAESIAYELKKQLIENANILTAAHSPLSGWIFLDDEFCNYNEPNIRGQEYAAATLTILVEFALSDPSTLSA